MPFFQVTRTISTYVEAPDEDAAISALVRLAADLPENYETGIHKLSNHYGRQLKARGSVLDEMP